MSVRSAFVAAGVPAAIAAGESVAAQAAMREAHITTQPRARQFLAQVLHESGRLRFFQEIASGAAYEGRRDLGNVRPGDGRRYKGRGPIQLTGRANYRAAGKALGLPLEARPDLAARHAVGWRIAAWYWRTRGLNALADRGDFLGITRRINGGTNGLADRQACLSAVSRVDCRPDPLWAHTGRERRWIREYDALVRAGKGDSARAEALRDAMRAQRKRIWRAASTSGWDRRARRPRYRSLFVRSR
jgi:predicted chitinase